MSGKAGHFYQFRKKGLEEPCTLGGISMSGHQEGCLTHSYPWLTWQKNPRVFALDMQLNVLKRVLGLILRIKWINIYKGTEVFGSIYNIRLKKNSPSEISQWKTNTVRYHLHVESKKYNKLANITKKEENKLVVTSWERKEGTGNINIEGKGLGSTNYQV